MNKTYVATASCEGQWWVITVDGVGVTQSRTLRDAPNTDRGIVSAMLVVDEQEIAVLGEPALESAPSRVYAPSRTPAWQWLRHVVAGRRRCLLSRCSTVARGADSMRLELRLVGRGHTPSAGPHAAGRRLSARGHGSASPGHDSVTKRRRAVRALVRAA